jgi:hypothetical protein
MEMVLQYSYLAYVIGAWTVGIPNSASASRARTSQPMHLMRKMETCALYSVQKISVLQKYLKERKFMDHQMEKDPTEVIHKAV